MEVAVHRQYGPMGRKVAAVEVEVPAGQERNTSARVTVQTDVGPVELAVWPDGTVVLGTREAPAGTPGGREYYHLFSGHAVRDKQRLGRRA